jgi:hypothetical protein
MLRIICVIMAEKLVAYTVEKRYHIPYTNGKEAE